LDANALEEMLGAAANFQCKLDVHDAFLYAALDEDTWEEPKEEHDIISTEDTSIDVPITGTVEEVRESERISIEREVVETDGQELSEMGILEVTYPPQYTTLSIRTPSLLECFLSRGFKLHLPAK
jgi:hypothetical protein